MQLEHTGGGEYLARSESDGLPYMVDVLDNSGKGSCQCKDFSCRRKKHQDDEFDPNAVRQSGSCKHLHAAKQHFLTLILPKLANNQKDK